MSDFKNQITKVSTIENFIAEVSEVDEEYMEYFNKLPAKVQTKIKKSVNRVSNGMYAVAPLTCLGPSKCPFLSKCPLAEIDEEGQIATGDLSNYPYGRDCVLEKFFIQQKVIEYVNHLKVEPSNPVEMAIVNELALIDLYKNRAAMIMSAGDKKEQGRDFMRVDIIGFNENGDVAEQSQLHPVYSMIDQLEKRREKWLDRLMETRKAKADMLAKFGSNENSSRVLLEIEALKKAIIEIDSSKTEEEGIPLK